MRSGRVVTAIALVLGLAAAGGCATVPGSSPVQVLRGLGTGAAPATTPVDGTNPLDLVRDFVVASGSSADHHGSARRFLAPEAAKAWDDGVGVTVLDDMTGRIDTVPAPTPARADRNDDSMTIRIRGVKIGRLTPSGSFEPDQATTQVDVDLVRRDGQWRISRLPDGVVVGLAGFRSDYKPVPIWFLDADPARRLAIADMRYIPTVPATAQAARVIDVLLMGPSRALLGAATTALPGLAKLRSNVSVSSDGATVVDLTKLGDLDEAARKLLAAQVVLSLAAVNVTKVRLLVDGEPLIANGKTDWAPSDVERLVAEVPTGADVPAFVVAGGRVVQIAGPEPAGPLPGPFGNGSYVAESAAATANGKRLAVVVKSGNGRILLVSGGADAGVAPVPLSAATMSRPTWTPTGGEVWTVMDSRAVARVSIDNNGNIRTGQVDDNELAALGRISGLRISRDGMRVAAVVNGGLYTAAVVRTDGEVAIRNIRRLAPTTLGEVVDADWRASESIVAITRGVQPKVVQVTADGLVTQEVAGNNLTPPLTAIAAAPNRPLLVTDQVGVWSFAGGEQDAWRQVPGGTPGTIPVYPG